MSRLKQALQALTGTLPEVVREVPKEVEVTKDRLVPIGDSVRTVFVAESKAHKAATEAYYRSQQDWWRRSAEYKTARDFPNPYNPYRYASNPGSEPQKPSPPEWHGRVYLSCAQAFDELGADADLTPHLAVLSGNKAYLLTGMAERDVQPKKRARSNP